jgi:hypothetical protein
MAYVFAACRVQVSPIRPAHAKQKAGHGNFVNQNNLPTGGSNLGKVFPQSSQL